MKELEELKKRHKRRSPKEMPEGWTPSKADTKNLLRNLNQAMLRYLDRSKNVYDMLLNIFNGSDSEVKNFRNWARK